MRTRQATTNRRESRLNVKRASLLVMLVVLGAENAAEESAPPGRMEFAQVPEIALIEGVPETIQLGPWQLDPVNPWTPGDFTRASGWKSRIPTRLVTEGPGPLPAGLAYASETGELRYTGGTVGDVIVRLKTADGSKGTAPFRIRVLRPTVVYGDNAAAINTQQRWGAALVCETPMSFADCRKRFRGGKEDAAPLVLFITPGSYSEDLYLGNRRFLYMLGDARNRPMFTRNSLGDSKFERFTVANLILNDTNISQGSASKQWPSWLNISRIRQYGETKAQNGVSNPNGLTEQPWHIDLWSMESQGMGHPGNTTHSLYLEGRPRSHLAIMNARFLGSRGSSAVKTTMQDVQIRHTLFSVSEIPGDVSSGLLMHTPVDSPAVSDLVVYGNEFQLWRGTTAGVPAGRSGILAGAIFLRLRQAMTGSDRPAYPTITWTPPTTAQTTMSSPGGGFGAGPQVFASDEFWKAVRARPITEPDHEFSFKHYIGFNRFVMLPGSMPVIALRDDGTYPADDVYQFGPMRARRTHPLWVERSVSFLFGNEYVGFAADAKRLRMDANQKPKEIEAGAKWPRTKPEEFPHAVELTGELPAWFKL
jgi:hypothetical protein